MVAVRSTPRLSRFVHGRHDKFLRVFSNDRSNVGSMPTGIFPSLFFPCQTTTLNRSDMHRMQVQWL